MHISKKLKKRISITLAAAMVAGIPALYPQQANASNLTSLIGIAGLGMKINSYTRYNYVLPKDLSAGILCVATNADAQNPTSGGVGTYSCHIMKVGRDSKYMFPAGYTTAKISFSGNAGASQTASVALAYNKVTGYADGKPTTERGTIPITIRVELSGGANTMIGSGGDGTFDKFKKDADNVFSTNDPTTGDPSSQTYQADPLDGISSDSPIPQEGYNDGDGPCTDGSYFCPEESKSNTNDPSWWGKGDGGSSGGGGSGGSEPGSGVPSGGDVPNVDNPSGGTVVPGGQTTQPTTDTPNYGDVINDMLGDKDGNSYNSPNDDWSSSNGNGSSGSGDNGIGDLDDYFNGVGDGSSNPNGLTTDDLPLDSAEGNNGEEVTGDGQENSNGAVGNEGSGDSYSDGTSGSGGEAQPEKEHLGNFDGIPGAYQEALNNLDGLNNGGNGLLGDMDGSSADSLKDKLKDLLSNKDNSLSNGSKRTASDQELCDIAKKVLLANGYTAADIAAGKNYDSGSAYTEPLAAWDMNRITTLLRGRKISLTSPTDVKKETTSSANNNSSALSHVSKASLSKGNQSQK